MKAIERREAAEALKEQVATVSENIQIKNVELDKANKRCANHEKHLNELVGQLKLANQAITKLQAEMDPLKKNYLDRSR